MPDTLFRVTLLQNLYGQQVQNVIHFRGPSSDPLQMTQLADEVNATWVVKVRTTQRADLVYNGIKVVMLESQFAPLIKTINVAGVNGGNDNDICFVAAIWRLRTALIGKRGRGRVYIAGVVQNISNKGFLQAATVQAWQARQAEILQVFGPGGSSTFRLVLCPSKPPFQATDVISMDVAPTWGSQRRRNIGVGI